jgi:4-hydroxy-3-polyprenylbenzoate decarboxylase
LNYGGLKGYSISLKFNIIFIMAYSGLSGFINALENKNELHRIKPFVDPVLEITEIADRISKSAGKALLFENTGTDFPVLINAFGSETRMSMAIGRKSLDAAGSEIENIFNSISQNRSSIFEKITSLPSLIKLAGCLPSRKFGRGTCQQVIHRTPDLGIIPEIGRAHV